MTRPLLSSVLAVLAFAALATPTGLLPKDGAVVPTHTELQKSYLNIRPRADRIAKFADKNFRKQLAAGKSYPLPTELSWKAEGECEVTVSRKADGHIVYSAKTADGKVSVDNLEIACDYVWKVKDASGEASSVFRTEDEAPRLLRVAHVPNVRDLGGRIGLNGRRVKQNLVFRSAGLNDNASALPMDKGEIAKADPTGAILAAGEKIAAYRNSFKVLRASKDGPVFPKIELPKEWLVSDVADKMEMLDGAVYVISGAFPKEGRTVAVDADGVADLQGKGFKNWVALSGTINAESDGYAALGVSADWFWALEVNGIPVRSYLAGNRITAESAGHQVLVPVKKGANPVRALLGTGSVGFIFVMRELPASNRDKLVDKEINALKDLVGSFAGESKKLTPGKTRIHDDNRDFWLKTLGIRSDIDLRSDKECFGMEGSPLGPTVTWFHISSSAYEGMQNDNGRGRFAKVFRVFLDEKNYPIDFHCIAGQDRTGSVAFILNGLLGVSEEELYLDWESTGFWNGNVWFSHQGLFNKLVAGFEKHYPEGRTINDKIELYVKSLGFTDADIAKFRGIMLEK